MKYVDDIVFGKINRALCRILYPAMRCIFFLFLFLVILYFIYYTVKSLNTNNFLNKDELKSTKEL